LVLVVVILMTIITVRPYFGSGGGDPDDHNYAYDFANNFRLLEGVERHFYSITIPVLTIRLRNDDFALYEDVLAWNWMLKVNFGNHGIIRPDSCAGVSVCEYDKSMSVPIAGDASPRIFDVVCQTDQIVLRGSTNLKTACLRLNIMVKRAQDYISQTAFGKQVG
jgi:hypothetical protein